MAACTNAETRQLLALFEDALATGSVVLSIKDAWMIENDAQNDDACTGEEASTSEHEQELSAEEDHVVAQPAHADVRLAGGKPPMSALAPRSSKVCILTAELAATIFLARKERTGKRGLEASRLAHQFGVSPRTVRDIWNLRTWAKTTRPLWSSADFARAAKKQQQKQQQRRAPRDARKPNAGKPEARKPEAAHDEWKLCDVWLTPGEEWERDEFDSAMDYIFASHYEWPVPLHNKCARNTATTSSPRRPAPTFVKRASDAKGR